MITLKKVSSTLWVSAIVLFFSACGSSSSTENTLDKVTTEIVALTKILQGVETQKDYDSAKADIDLHVKNLEDLKKIAGGNFSDMTPEEQKKTSKKSFEKYMTASTELAEAGVKAGQYGFVMPDMN